MTRKLVDVASAHTEKPLYLPGKSVFVTSRRFRVLEARINY